MIKAKLDITYKDNHNKAIKSPTADLDVHQAIKLTHQTDM